MVSLIRKRSTGNYGSNTEVNSNESHYNQQISSSLSSCSNSNSNNNEYIWILIELVEYIMLQQQTKPNDDTIKIPHQWKPTQQSRKRSRSSDTLSPKKGSNDSNHSHYNGNSHHYWGWCRAIVLQQQQQQQSSSSSSSSSLPSLKTTVTAMSIQINDLEFAPSSYQNRILQFSYDTPYDKNNTLQQQSQQQQLHIHRCNDWWLMANERQGQLPLETSPPKLSSILKSSPNRRHGRGTGITRSSTCRTTSAPKPPADTAVPSSIPYLEPPNDLTLLEQLHEPAVLYCLYRRFRSVGDEATPPQIYTYTGKILIAMNPFVAIPNLYGDTIMELYYNNNQNNNNSASITGSSDGRMNNNNTHRSDDLKSHAISSSESSSLPLSPPPHIYAIAQNAYSSISLPQQQHHHTSTANNQRITKNNQCILVSGESGAGKTVTTKIVLQYLARLSQQRQHQQASSASIATATTAAIPKAVTPLSPRTNRRRQVTTTDTTTPTPSNGDSSSGRHIELQILESNPILESFGNARTIRNDNSSRFGKYIELSFDVNHGTIVSATIQTYLLEKVRLISQSYNERNYHIFYEILSPPLAGGLSPKERQLLHVTGKTVHDFHMTCISQTYDRRDNVKDRDTYRELRQALDIVGFTRQEQLDLFTVVCALLYISNVTFVVPTNGDTGNSSTLDVSNPSLRYALDLLGVDLNTFNNAMCTCTIEARNEILIKHLSMDRAEKAVEAFIKTTYSALFNYIVKKINSFITVLQAPLSENDIGNQSSTTATASIGVLDIFGFESFDRNSFEQLCINYCNEALQQQFNKFVFKNEQLEYEREYIDWSFISFPDNQDVLDLIEKRHDGILSILDEQCRLPRCTDATFANALYQKCGNSTSYPRLHVSKAMQAQYAFAIHHYAGLVEYNTEGFIEKNQDELPKSTTELLQSSSNPFFVTLGRELSLLSGDSSSSSGHQQSPIPGSYANRNKTPPFHRSGSNSLIRESVGTQFSSQLKTLRTRIESTSPHYVRCIKPNDDLKPNYFDANVIADQLRCAGVFEAIRVSRVGFPHRYFHDHFIQRFGLLERQVQQRQQQRWNATTNLQPKEQCVSLVNLTSSKLAHLMAPVDEQTTSKQSLDGYVLFSLQFYYQHMHQHKSYLRLNFILIRSSFLGMQVGRTKVFIQSRAYELLENMRSKKLAQSAICIQKVARMFVCRINFEIAIYAVNLIQRFVRCRVAFRLARILKIDRSVKIIQRSIRCSKARIYLNTARYVACWCQSAYRGAIARQYCAYIFLDQKATCIQMAWKKSRSKFSIRALRKATIALQTRFRCRVAMRELLRLRMEARDVSALAAERDKYREESNQLRRELEEVKASPEKFFVNVKPPPSPGRVTEMERLRIELNDLHMELDKFHRMSSPSKSVDERAERLQEELSRRESELKFLRQEVAALRSKDDLSSAMKSMTIDTTMRSSSAGGGWSENTRSNIPLRSTTIPCHRASPVRSDVSLLDDDIDDDLFQSNNYTFKPYEIVEDITSNHDNIVSDDDDGNTELRHLHTAIRQKTRKHFDHILHQTSEVCVLINHGDKYGRTAMHLAAIGLDIDIAEILLNRGAVVNAQDDDGETPLHLAENAPMTEFLLRQGKANPNIPNIDGICSLHLAVQRRDIDSVRILLRYNANVNNADNIRWFTPLHLVALPARNDVDEGQLDDDLRCRIAELLTGGNYGTSTTNVNTTSTCSDENVIPDLNYQDSEGNTPLHYAVQLETNDAYALLNILLERDANPNIQNLRGQVAFHLLCHNDKLRTLFPMHYTEMINALLSHGANPSISSQTGCTALHLALYHHDIDTAVVLVRSGAELHTIWKKVGARRQHLFSFFTLL